MEWTQRYKVCAHTRYCHFVIFDLMLFLIALLFYVVACYTFEEIIDTALIDFAKVLIFCFEYKWN